MLTWSKDKAIGEHTIISKFLKGVFNLRPSLPKSCVTWDTRNVLEFLRSWYPLKNLSLFQLSIKTVLLMLLISGQRGQTIHVLKIKDVEKRGDSYVCRISVPIKTSNKKHHQKELTFKSYKEKALCVVHCLQEYLKRTKILRKGRERGRSKLFISTRKPHKPICRDTLSNWVKKGLKLSGVNMDIFTAHSTRAASTSKVKGSVKLSTILKTAGWRRSQTFAKYYDKVVEDDGWGVQDLI